MWQCLFKRPVGHFTGKLIQDAGLQGLKMGRCSNFRKSMQGFIVNIDHATATDYVELIAHIQEVIKEKNLMLNYKRKFELLVKKSKNKLGR